MPDCICETCGVTFHKKSSKNRGRFCSVPCYDAWQGRNTQELVCAVCGNTFEVVPSRAVRTSTQFCSKACNGIAFTQRSIGRIHNGRPVIRNKQGYLLVWQPDHAGASHGRVLEHRLVAEQKLGRPLSPDDQVHHINGLKDDNRPENLMVLDATTHTAITLEETGMRRSADRARIRELEAAENSRIRELEAEVAALKAARM